MNTQRFKQLENEVKQSVNTLCESHPQLVEDLYDDNVEKNDKLQDDAMRRSLAKSLVN